MDLTTILNNDKEESRNYSLGSPASTIAEDHSSSIASSPSQTPVQTEEARPVPSHNVQFPSPPITHALPSISSVQKSQSFDYLQQPRSTRLSSASFTSLPHQLSYPFPPSPPSPSHESTPFNISLIRNSGQQQKQFGCLTCPKRFSRRSDLVRHERIHTGIRPNVCGVCGKQFIQRSALTVHMRVHTGEKPHKCDICEKAFSDSSSLARHRRVHTGNRPYVCNFPGCRRTFTRRTTLTRHISTHGGWSANMNNEAAAGTTVNSASLSPPQQQPPQPALFPSQHYTHYPPPPLGMQPMMPPHGYHSAPWQQGPPPPSGMIGPPPPPPAPGSISIHPQYHFTLPPTSAILGR
jgi:uncharacterized Zn-finger protein